MTNLKPLIEYQSIDIELLRSLRDLKKHPDHAKLDQVRHDFDAARQSITSAEESASHMLSFFDTLKQSHDEMLSESDKLIKELEKSSDNEEKSREIVAKLETIKNNLATLEKKSTDKQTKSEKIVKTFKVNQDKVKKLREEFTAVKARIETFTGDKEPKIAALRTKLDTLRKGIDQELYKKYQQLTTDGKIPALAESRSTDNGKTYTCLGCGITIAQASKSKLLENGFCNCDSCRRMIYDASKVK